MSEGVILVLDFDSVCRFCLHSSGALSEIFDDDENSITKQLISFINIKIEPQDNLPAKICHRCRYKIEMCFDFREMVLKTQKALRDNVTEEVLNMQIKSEANDTEKTVDSDNKLENRSEIKTAEEDAECAQEAPEYPEVLNFVDMNMEHLEMRESHNVDTVQPITRYSKTSIGYKKIISKNRTGVNVSGKDYPSMLTAKRKNMCLLCFEMCDNAKSLEEHVDKHMEGTDLEPYYLFGEREITCKPCQRKFGYRFSFLIHQREHLNLKPFLCSKEGCGLAFYSTATLRQHQSNHASKRFECQICGVKFKRKSDLRGHEIIHKDAGIQFQCPVCQIVCKNRLTLAAHVKKHCAQPKFKCASCPKSYFSRSELERHSNIHSGEKRFRCSSCDSAYFSRTALRRHEKGHFEKGCLNKRCPLKQCPMNKEARFASWDEFKAHMSTHSPSDYPFCCPHCGKGLYTQVTFTKHTSLCGQVSAKDAEEADEEQCDVDNPQPTTYYQVIHPTKEVQEIHNIYVHPSGEEHLVIIDMIDNQKQQIEE